MALASRLATVSQSHGVIYKGGNGRTVTVRANGDDIFLTAIVTAYGETLPDVDLAGSGEPVSGVIIAEAFPYKVDLSKDSDSPFDDNTYLHMYVPQDGDQLYLTVKTNSSIAQENWFKADGGFIVTSAKADALGRIKEAITAVSGTEQIALCEWGVDA
jgi:hypothetical protein